MHLLNIVTFFFLSAISSFSLAGGPAGPIVEVSEPSTLALFAISAAALFLTKRHKNN
jgi:hypothetical protein